MCPMLTLLAVLLITPVAGAMPDDTPTLEYQIKASYLFNFIRFVEWPPAAEKADTFRLCVFGENRFGSALDTLAGETVRGVPIAVLYFRGYDGLENCHAVYVSTATPQQESRVLRHLADRPVLIVGESAGFAARGGVIHLVLVEDRIRFIINQQSAAEHQLKISSQLLQLAVPE